MLKCRLSWLEVEYVLVSSERVLVSTREAEVKEGVKGLRSYLL